MSVGHLIICSALIESACPRKRVTGNARSVQGKQLKKRQFPVPATLRMQASARARKATSMVEADRELKNSIMQPA